MQHVVYFVVDPAAGALAGAESSLMAAAGAGVPGRSPHLQIHFENDVSSAINTLRSTGAYPLIVDARCCAAAQEPAAMFERLSQLLAPDTLQSPICSEQTWMIVDPGACGTNMSFVAGRSHFAGTVAAARGDEGWLQIWEKIQSVLSSRQRGKVALCLGGGGIEGVLYELGALRALQYFIPDFGLQNADMICGISGGAIVSALLASGVSLAELAHGIEKGGPRIDKIERNVLFDLNAAEFVRRIASSAVGLVSRRVSPLQAVFRLVPTAAFAGNKLRGYLQRQLTKPGMTNRFSDTPRELYIGATDQDTAEHVVFSADEWDHVPIHLAVRASAALAPFYTPQMIDGRYYIDGAFSRTCDAEVAVRHGATLVIIVDPLVPLRSHRAGHVASKGGVLVGMQGLKSLISGRLERELGDLRASYPHVAFHLFQPDGTTMRMMSGSPMKFFFRAEIEQIACRETIRSIRSHRLELLHNDFARHGIVVADPDPLGSSLIPNALP